MVTPITATISLRSGAGSMFKPTAALIRESHFMAITSPCSRHASMDSVERVPSLRSLNASTSRKRAELLLQLRRERVRHDQRELIFVMQLEHVTDAMNLRDQSRFRQRHAKARAQPP